MSKDQFQDKYNEIFQYLKEDKMDWDFEDFLQKAEGGQPKNNGAEIIPLKDKNTSLPKWFWMAASVLILFSIGFIFTYNQKNNAENQAKLVETEIRKQKKDFIEKNQEPDQQVAVNHIDSISGAKKDSILQENMIAEKDVLDEILPKRGRLKKEAKPRYVDNSYNKKYNSSKKDSTAYKDSYVIVNGKRIDNVEEAINVTKYSFQIFANNVSEKLIQPKVMDEDY